MQPPSRLVRFGFSLIAVLLVTGLVYASYDMPDAAQATTVARATVVAGG